MDCPRCGRKLGEEKWQVCPGCGADLRGMTDGRTISMPPVPPSPGRPEATRYQPPYGQQYIDTRTARFAQPYVDPRTGQYVRPYFDPRTGRYVQGYDGAGGAQYPQAAYPGYQAAYPAEAGRRGSVPLGLLTVLLGAAIAGSTFLSWLNLKSLGISMNITGWFAMNTGTESLGGGGFKVVLTDQGSVFFTGFFSLLFGVLILLCGIVMLIRRRGAGVASLLLSMAAASMASVNIAMTYAKIHASPGAGLWVFAAASLASLVLAVIAIY